MVALAGALGVAAGWALSGFARAQGCRLPAWAVAVGSGALWAALAWRLGWTMRLGAAALLVAALWLAACIDLYAYRIPNLLVAGIAAVGAAAQAFPRAAFAPPLGCALAGLAAAAAFALLAGATRGGFGWGDAKLAAAMAWVLGPRATAAAMLATGLAGGIAAAVALALRRRRLGDALPFAPFFLVGGLLALLAG